LQGNERYFVSEEYPPLVEFEAEAEITKAVRAFMSASIDCATQNGHGKRGSFLVNCVSTKPGEFEGVQERLRQAIEEKVGPVCWAG
jgi:hypothetical protein